MFDMFGLGLAFGAVYFITLAPFALLSLAFPYAVLRLRNEEPADPQLGTKIGIQYFFSVAVIVGLTGLTINAVDLATRDDAAWQQPQPFGRPMAGGAQGEVFNAAQRTGLAMVLSGFVLALLHFALARIMTNKDHWPRVRRTFAGWRFAIQGIVVTFAVTALIILLLQHNAFEPPTYRSIKALLAVLGVWVPAWLVHLYLLQMPSAPPRVYVDLEVDEEAET